MTRTIPTDPAVPMALRSTFAARQAGKVLWDIRHPVEASHGLVCISDTEETVEDHRTKDFIGVRRSRHYAYKDDLATVVAVRYDDEEQLRWVDRPVSTPPRPRAAGFIRRFRSGR